MEMITVTAEEYNRKEKKFFEEGCEYGRKKCGEWLEAQDEKIMQERDRKRYRCVDKRSGTIKTKMGEVNYERRYYREEVGEGVRYVFLLDEMLGFGESGLYSGTMIDLVVEESIKTSYAKAAKAVSEMTGQSISGMGAWQIVQNRGAQIAERERELAELNDRGGLQGKIETKVLFEEMDGVWLSMQGKDRPKKGGKREIKIATRYSGWRETGHGRYETVGKQAYAGFDEPKEFRRRSEARLAQKYDVDGIDIRILNGDGASWIKGIDEDAVMQLDPFHRSRALTRGLADKAARSEARRLLKEKDVDGALGYIKSLAENSKEEKEAKRINELYRYFNDNKAHLLTWDERGIKLPPPPKGVVYRRLGTQEHSNCVLITHRMKHRKASWSIKGAGHMAKLLCLHATGDPRELFSNEGMISTGNRVVESLSAAKVPSYDGRGDDGGLSRGGWPYDGASLTEGRKTVKDIFHFKVV